MAGTIGTNFGSRLRINLGMDVGKIQFASQYPQGGISGGFRGSHILKAGEAVKQVERLAPPLVHVCGFIWEWT